MPKKKGLPYRCPKCGSRKISFKDEYSLEGNLVHKANDKVKCLSCSYGSIYAADFLPGGQKRIKKSIEEENKHISKEWKSVSFLWVYGTLIIGVILLILSFYFKSNAFLFLTFFMVGFMSLIAGLLFFLGKRVNR